MTKYNSSILKILRYINLLVLLGSKILIDNTGYQFMFIILCSILPISMRLLKNKHKGNNKVTWVTISLFFLALVLSIIWLKSDYGISGALIDFAFLIIAYLEFSDDIATIYSDKIIFKIAYIVLTLLLIYWLLYNLKINKKYFYFYNIGYDKNYSGILIFFYYSFCLKNNFKMGQVVAGIYSLILKSRLLLIIFVFTYILKVLLKNNFRIAFVDDLINKITSFSTKQIVLTFFTFTVIVSMFSFFVTKYVPTNSITKYGESLNDTSNAIRVRANYYAVNQIIHNPQFIFFGYDEQIKSALGVENELTATKYFGFRLVQPHNFILNYILRYGLILTIIYVTILSRILYRWWNKENIPIIISYILMNMSMHSLLSTIYLIIFLFIIVINNNPKEIKEGEKIDEY